MFSDLDKNGYISTDAQNNELLQENDYYPFGLKHAVSAHMDNTNKYTYNQKEMHDLGNFDMYYYYARFFDPAIARWHNADPANQYLKPYIGIGNDPVNLIDPDGRSTSSSSGNDKYLPSIIQRPDPRSLEVTWFTEYARFLRSETDLKRKSDLAHSGWAIPVGTGGVESNFYLTQSWIGQLEIARMTGDLSLLDNIPDAFLDEMIGSGTLSIIDDISIASVDQNDVCTKYIYSEMLLDGERTSKFHENLNQNTFAANGGGWIPYHLPSAARLAMVASVMSKPK